MENGYCNKFCTALRQYCCRRDDVFLGKYIPNGKAVSMIIRNSF